MTATRSTTRPSALAYDSGYLGAVATPGTYGLFSRAETNKVGGWYLYTANGYPSGVTGGGMINDNPATGGALDNTTSFEIHFEGTSFTLYGLTNPGYGMAKGTLDEVDIVGGIPYNTTTGLVIVYQITGLAAGRHVFKHIGDIASTSAAIPQYYIVA